MSAKRIMALIMAVTMCLCLVPAVSAGPIMLTGDTDAVRAVPVETEVEKSDTEIKEENPKTAGLSSPLNGSFSETDDIIVCKNKAQDIRADGSDIELPETKNGFSGEFNVVINSQDGVDETPRASMGGLSYAKDFPVGGTGNLRSGGGFSGSGTSEDPFKITSKNDLLKLASDVNSGNSYAGKYFILTNDIDLSDENWTPIGNAWDITFNGVFSGNDCKISGLSVESTEDYVGLFGCLTGTVSGLSLEGNVTGGSYVGGIAGCSYGKIENCDFTGTVTGRDYVGGIAGCSGMDASVRDCDVNAEINADGTGIGGVVGWANNIAGASNHNDALNDPESNATGSGIVERCSYTGELTGRSPYGLGVATSENGTITITVTANAFGGIVGWNNGCIVSDCNNYGTVNGDDFAGGIVGDSCNGGRVEFCGNYGTVNGASMLNGGIAGRIAEGSIYRCGNSGTVTGGDFTGGVVGAIDKYSSISYCSNNTQGSVVSESGKYVGGVVGIANCAVSDNCFNDGSVTGSYGVGGVVGWTTREIRDCHNGGTVTALSSEGRVGGVAGNSYGLIENCYNGGCIDGVTKVTDEVKAPAVGGICGYLFGTMKNCYNSTYATVLGGVSVGGCVGGATSSALVSGCHNDGAVSGESQVGGIVGIAYCLVSDCVNKGTGTVTGSDVRTGGVIGCLDEKGSAEHVTNEGTVIGARYVGGLFGITLCEVSGLTNSGSVTGGEYTGGVVGFCDVISGCSNSGTVKSSTSDKVGGIVGASNGRINLCTNTGAVEGKGSAGGIAGAASAVISDCTNSAIVTGTGIYTGGILGYAGDGAEVSGCKNTGAVSGTEHVAGIVGYTYGTGSISDCRNTEDGKITGSGDQVGGIVGSANVPVSNCENNGTVSGPGTVGGIVGLATIDAPIDRCTNTSSGSVTGTGNSIGGILGGGTGTLDNCVNEGSVTGKDNAGGIAGNILHTGIVRNCLNKGSISGADCVGGLVGKIGETSDGTEASGVLESSKNNGTVEGNASVGGAAGILHGTACNCENNGTVTGKGTGVAGVVGYCKSGGTVSGCKNLSTFTAGAKMAGGVVGANAGTVSGCVNKAEVKGGSFETIGGIVGSNGITGTITGCTNTANVSSSTSCIGGITGLNYGKITGCANGGQISTSSGLVGGITGESCGDVTDCTNTGKVNSKTDGTAYAGGIVGLSNGGNITGCSNSNQISGGGGIGGIVGSFTGSKTIKNCTNTGYINAYVGFAGGIVGSLQENCTLSNCTNTNTVNGNGKDYVGGIAGQVAKNNNISDCVNGGAVSGAEYVGGIIGANVRSGNYTRLTNNGKINGTVQVGGIIGDCYATVSDCRNTASVTGVGGSGDGVGGIAGRCEDGSISQCDNTGAVTGTYMTGGIVGVAESDVTECYNHAGVTSNVGNEANVGIGGIVGYSSGINILKCVNYAAAISGGNNGKRVGGIVGWTSHTNVELCRNYSDVKAYKEAGGIAGFTYDVGNPHDGKNYTVVQKCINTGNVSASAAVRWDGLTLYYCNANVGGIVGKADWYTVINQCTSNNPNAKISAPDGDRAGGIVGYLYNATVKNSYNTSQVSAYDRAGGIVGEMAATSLMETCFNYTGSISKAYVAGTRGALLGYYNSNKSSPTFRYNYWKHTTALGPINGKGELGSESGKYDYLDHWAGGKKFNSQDSFTGFSFPDPYVMQTDRPKLKIEPDVPASVGPDETPDPIPKTIQIYTVQNLADLRDKVNSGVDFRSTTVYLCADLDMSSVSNWTPIGTNSSAYRGTFDGQGHTIYNLKVSGNVDHAGLFGASYALIKNLEVHGSVSSSSSLSGACVGGILGVSLGGRVESCAFFGDVSSTKANTYSGGVLGAISGGGASNCYHVGTVSGSTVGGVTGYIYSGTLENCFHYSGSVTGSSNVGGVIGENVKGTVRNCFALSGTASKAISKGSAANVGFKSAAEFCGSGPIGAGGWSTGVWAAGGDYPEIRALCNIATLDPNGGSGSAGQYGVRKFGGALPLSPFSRDGYILVGWNTEADGSGTPYNCGDSIDKNVNLYAQWLKGTPYHGYYSFAAGSLFDNNNGSSWTGGAIGSGESNVTDFRSNDAVRPSAIAFVMSGNVCSAPPSWRLEGKVSSNGVWTPLASGDGTSLSLAGHTVYANLSNAGDSYYSYYRIIWEGPSSPLELLDAYLIVADENVDVRRPVILYINDGTDTTTPVDVKNGEILTLSNPFTSDNRFFLNWNTRADGSGKSYANYEKITVDGALDLYAQWLDGTHYHNYTALKAYDQSTPTENGIPQNDSQYLGYNNQEYTCLVDDNINTKWCVSVRADAYWSLEFTTDEYVKPLGYALVTAEDCAKYSVRNPKNWTLEGLGEDGTWIMLDGILQDQSLPAANHAEICRKVGNNQEYCTFRITFRGLGGGSTFQLSEMYLITDGTARKPSVKFDGHGGTGNIPPISAKTGSSVTLPECSFTRKGYDFTAWNTKADGTGKSYDPGKEFVAEGDSTLYAQWEPSVYTVRFLDESGNSLYETTLASGQLPVYKGPAPSKDGGTSVTYTFKGWSPVIGPVTDNTDYSVLFEGETNTFGDPEWNWSSKHTSATAIFTCINNPSLVETITTKDISVSTTEPSCTEDGSTAYTAYVTFNDVKYSKTETVTIPKTGHSYSLTGWKWTGYSKAEAVITCANDASHIYYIEATVTSARTEPTCEGEGKVVYTAEVVFDNETYKDQKTETLEPSGHNYVLTGWNWTGYTAAEAVFTCTKDASHVIKVPGEISSVRTEPTADDDGSVEYTAKAVFGNDTYKDKKTEVLPALGRDYELTGWTWEGYTSAKALFTDKNGSGDISVDAEISSVRTEPTCEGEGKVVYTASVLLNEQTYSDKVTEVLAAQGHSWGKCEYVWSDDDNSVTATVVCERDSSHVIKETVSTNFVLTQFSTYKKEGSGYFEAVFSNELFTKQVKEITVPAVSCDGGPTCPSGKFKDEPSAEEWIHLTVDWAVVNRVTFGTEADKFSPHAECSRAQFVTFLWRTVGQPGTTLTESPFKDVKEGAWYYTAVLWAYENNITMGTDAHTFSPDDPCSRAQVVTFLWRMEGCEAPAASSTTFTDVKSGEWYYDAVLWAVEKGITAGTTSTTFSPDGSCTRIQCIAFIFREFAV